MSESIDHTSLSRTQKHRKHFLALIIAVSLVLVSVIAPRWDGSVQSYMHGIGLGLICLAILGRCWCTLYIAAKKKTALVTIGPYSLCRNPLYVFSLIGTCGLGLLTGSFVLTAFFTLSAFLVFNWVILREERYLAKNFSPEYQDYCFRTGRWLPRLSAWRDQAHIETRPRLMLITLRDGACLLACWPIFNLLAEARLSGVFAPLFTLP
ncbi:methyltransferase family protein [Aestuariispira insulae]|uniref:Protein-S-isoprenylcysteine O-methyltransferase Ste14 n=1 Tax=Aestuariispira insulae TaxID=1461337 RepID=A0A3D9HU47_9PROT|nr:isoprenylcysteine carboxylmethyltransferase family protein [Aestuariispira insulae]RED52406.1 protein-S-isoprenylcysteine O-methyltransferase Ste14 [Aestuariispira insulae]